MIQSTEATGPLDQALWNAAVAGDAEAFGLLFERHHVAVYNYCFRRTASWSDAEDLAAITFFEAWWSRRPMELHDGSLLPWLYGVATHTMSHRARSAGRHIRALRQLAAVWSEMPDLADEVASRLADEVRMRALGDAFTALPEHERQVLQLSLFAGLDYAAISVSLGIPIGTVRSRLARARDRIRQALVNDNADESLTAEGRR